MSDCIIYILYYILAYIQHNGWCLTWKLFNVSKENNVADPGGRAVYGVVLRPLASWGYGFESRKGKGCLSVLNVVWVSEVSAKGPITHWEESYQVCVCVFVCVCVCVCGVCVCVVCVCVCVCVCVIERDRVSQ